jgi:thioester reductase-like protein
VRTTFVTGVPGFIGTRLVRRLLEDRERRLVCLVFPDRNLFDKARRLADEEPDGRVDVIAGDISKPRLGLEPKAYDRLKAEVAEAFHLAALYNLAAPKDLSYEVNVEGTRNVLDLLAGARQLRRFVHVSTVVVSGDRTGTIYEHELEAGQGFRNYYEETKFLSEVEVRRRSGEIPTSIVRPAVVIGDSRSGEIDKYDGPYYFIDALARLERAGALGLQARILAAGEANALFHLIPVDFLIDVMDAVVSSEDALGKTFQVIDPNEITVAEFRSLVLRRFDVPEFPVRVPTRVLKAAFRVPGVEKMARIPRQALDYFDLDARYDSRNTRALCDKFGIECPRIRDYIDTLVAFVRSHPEVRPQLINA